MNLTLSAPEEDIKLAREWAKENNTSLNRIIRETIAGKAAALQEARRKKADEFVSFLNSVHIAMPEGWKFNREEANER